MSNVFIEIRIYRNVTIAGGISALLHVLILFLMSRFDLLNQHQTGVERSQPITVFLNPGRTDKPVNFASRSIAELSPPARLSDQVTKPKPPPSIPSNETPKVIEPTKPEPSITAPIASTHSAPTPPKQADLDPTQFPDMASYLNAIRERRRLSGTDAASINEDEIAREQQRSEAEARNTKQILNPQPSGTNGIFQILSMDDRTATFAFRGWKNEFSFSRREVYQVDVRLGEDVKRATIRKMIEIIRRYYSGDFNWDSLRLGRVVVLSARMQDNDGLEDFMLNEFFGADGLRVQSH